jgi:hypothetical protein
MKLPLTEASGRMRLRYDPFQVFRASKSPPGLYARQKWLGESDSPGWIKDCEKTAAALLSYPFSEMNHYAEAIETIRCLFGLHLTVRSSTAGIDAELSRLISKIDLKPTQIRVHLEDNDPIAGLGGLPFTQSRLPFLFTAASLFLASIFGREHDPVVIKIYEWLSEKGFENDGCWADTACTHNIFRAMVVHPQFSKTDATALAVEYFGGLQTRKGDWGAHLPFYQTLNALAHLDHPRVKRQLDKAFNLLADKQNRNGTWGGIDIEWNTFLSVHALKNKGMI